MAGGPATKLRKNSRSKNSMKNLIVVSFFAVLFAYQSFDVLQRSMALFSPVEVNSSPLFLDVNVSLLSPVDVDSSASLDVNTSDGDGAVGIHAHMPSFSPADVNASASLDVNASAADGGGSVDTDRSQQPNETNHDVWDRIPTPEASAFYEQFRRKNATIVVDQKVQPQPKVEFRATSGLGHRLLRQSALFHTARLSKFPHLSASWGWECGTNEEGHPDIYDNLFGFGPMTTEPEANARGAVEGNPETVKEPTPFAKMRTLKTDEKTRLVNYVEGYRYWSNCLALFDWKMGDIYEKAITDEQFFRQLRTLFRFNDQIRNFTDYHSFSERLVLGVHIRAGNGEKGDFTIKKRGFHDIEQWIRNASASLKRLAMDMAKSRPMFSLPPLVFVATDDISVVDKMTNATKAHGMEIVSFPQRYLSEGAGVTYDKVGKGDTCHESWVSQMIDVIVLGASDAVVAARYSSFTQSLPLYSVLADSIYWERPPDFDPEKPITYFDEKERPPKTPPGKRSFIDNGDDEPQKYANRLFCESNVLGDAFDCYDDYFRWLLKDDKKVLKQQVGNETLRQPYNKENYVPCPESFTVLPKIKRQTSSLNH